MTGIERIAIERQHQIDNGWTKEHDQTEGVGHIENVVNERLSVFFPLGGLTTAEWAELGAFAAAELDRRAAAAEVGE